MSHSSESPTLSSQLLFTFWLFAVLFLSSSFECNLRAYLIYTDFERPVDGDGDVLSLGRRVLMPKGTPFLDMYKFSPLEVQRKIGAEVTKIDVISKIL